MVVFPVLVCLIWAKLPDINNDDDKTKPKALVVRTSVINASSVCI